TVISVMTARTVRIATPRGWRGRRRRTGTGARSGSGAAPEVLRRPAGFVRAIRRWIRESFMARWGEDSGNRNVMTIAIHDLHCKYNFFPRKVLPRPRLR